MLKLGMLDFDTSHVVEFARRLNHKVIAQEHWVEGAQIVMGCPGVSRVMPDRVAPLAKKVQEECGVRLVDRPEELLGKVDGVLIESNDGSVHLERARPFLESGIPVWIDKPLAWTVRDAETLVGLAEQHRVPLFSASTMRYALEVQAFKAQRETLGPPALVQVWGPQNLNFREQIPGWLFYGVHCVELLFELLGPALKPVPIRYAQAGRAEQVSVNWSERTLAGISLVDQGGWPAGFTWMGEKGARSATLAGTYDYRELLRRIVDFFQTGLPPVAYEEMVAVVRFMDEINKAGAAGK